MRYPHNPLLFPQMEYFLSPWYKAMRNGEDPFGLFTDQPDLEAIKARYKESEYHCEPLSYFCSIATLEQFQRALKVIPLSLWEQSDKWLCAPVFFGAAYNNQVDVIRYVLSDQAPASFKTKLWEYFQIEKYSYGDKGDFFHQIARSGHVDVIRYVLSDRLPKNYKKFLHKDSNEGSFFHLIASSGNFEGIHYALSDEIPDDYKALRLKKRQYLGNFFHSLSIYQHDDVVRYALSDQVPLAMKALRLELNEFYDNFLYRVFVSYGYDNFLPFFITENPDLAVNLWVVNEKTGLSIDGELFRRKKKRPTEILEEIVKKIINQISDNPDSLTEKNKRILIVFKQRVFEFIKRYGFISDETKMKLIASSVLARIFGDDFDQALRIVSTLAKYKPTTLDELSFTYLITTVENVRQNGLVRFFKKNDEFENLLSKLIYINNVILRSCAESRDIACVLKLLFSDPRRGDFFTDDQKAIFFALRNIILNIEEVRIFMPRQAEKRDGELAESDFSKKLDEIERDMGRIVSSNHLDQAKLVLNGIRTLPADFKKINDFAKLHPGQLYCLDETEQRVGASERGHLPFHLENYGVDLALKNTLLRIVREFIAAFDVAKAAGQLKKFFDITISGNCLDGRTRDLVTWAAEFSGLKTLHELMGEYTQEFQAYHRVFENPSEDNTEATQFVRFVMQYHAGEHYKGCADIQPGKIAESVVQKYAETTLYYDYDKGCRCVVQ